MISYSSLCFAFIDPSIGRVNTASMSQQMLMELFIDKLINKEVVYGDFREEINSWNGLTINEDDNITAIDLHAQNLQGKINLYWVPSSVCELSLSTNRLCGTIQLEDLPNDIEWVFIDENTLTGCLNLEKLPRTLRSLYLNTNSFTGGICLTKLPPVLQHLSLYENQLSGQIDLTNLPEGLETLYLGNNLFEGETDFSKLVCVGLRNNPNLSGTIFLKKVTTWRQCNVRNTGVVIIELDD